jgi:murein DD-endopeptidase MepM/ murein hydrolase activator NlpD
VLNENTLEESWHVRLSRLSVILYSSILILTTFLLLALLIIATPLRYYLPGYGDTGSRSKIISESMQVDSIARQMELQQVYLDILKDVISGSIKPDTVLSLDSAQLKNMATQYIEKSQEEKEFIEKFEKEEKYNLTAIEGKTNEEIFVFFRPTKGIISSGFNPFEQQYGINIITSTNETVVSVLAGTVVYVAYTFDYGWVIQVQHENNYLSTYRNNSRLLKKAGDRVKAGEGIAITGDNSGTQFYFELWKQGKPINPEDVILF